MWNVALVSSPLKWEIFLNEFLLQIQYKCVRFIWSYFDWSMYPRLNITILLHVSHLDIDVGSTDLYLNDFLCSST